MFALLFKLCLCAAFAETKVSFLTFGSQVSHLPIPGEIYPGNLQAEENYIITLFSDTEGVDMDSLLKLSETAGNYGFIHLGYYLSTPDISGKRRTAAKLDNDTSMPKVSNFRVGIDLFDAMRIFWYAPLRISTLPVFIIVTEGQIDYVGSDARWAAEVVRRLRSKDWRGSFAYHNFKSIHEAKATAADRYETMVIQEKNAADHLDWHYILKITADPPDPGWSAEQTAFYVSRRWRALFMMGRHAEHIADVKLYLYETRWIDRHIGWRRPQIRIWGWSARRTEELQTMGLLLSYFILNSSPDEIDYERVLVKWVQRYRTGISRLKRSILRDPTFDWHQPLNSVDALLIQRTEACARELLTQVRSTAEEPADL